MTYEELIERYEESIINLMADSGWREYEVTGMLKFAWESGYQFRIQEEELNKGASF